MTGPLLCAKTTCTITGRHRDTCDTDTCRGCLPRQAADGAYLCEIDSRRLAEDALTAAGLYGELEHRLIGAGAYGEKVSGGQAVGIAVNDAAVDARALIRHTLVAWTRLITEERGLSLPTIRRPERLPEGFIGPPRLVTYTDSREATLGRLIATHGPWLAAQPYAGEAADQLRELAHGKPLRIARPSGTRTVPIGPCVQPGCAGWIHAVVRQVDNLLPSQATCDTDPDHTWTPDRWITLGRQLERRAA